MKKFLPLFAIAIMIFFLFTTAASCSGCRDEIGTLVNTDEKASGTEEETIEENKTENTGGSTSEESEDATGSDKSDVSESTAEKQAEDQNSGKEETVATEAPTLKLEIFEGPVYSSADDICYYRIKAVTTGIPEPVITFSKDDSLGAWGKSIAQVNLHQGQTYTLTAQAENDSGNASASIDLEWACGQGAAQDTAQDGNDEDSYLDLITIETKPDLTFHILNKKPVLNQSVVDPSASLKVGQEFYVRCEGYDPDGDDFIALIAYSPQDFELIEHVTPTAYKLKTLKAGTFTIDTALRDEHDAYSYDILLTITVTN